MASAFVATSGPAGWKLGRWSQTSKGWQELKLDNPSLSYQFEVVGGKSVPGSHTVRLKMKDHPNTEVLLLESSIQVFSNACYLGEYIGEWQTSSSPDPPTPTQKLSRPRRQEAHADTGGGGYTPNFSAQPARQAAPVAEKRSSLETTALPKAAGRAPLSNAGQTQRPASRKAPDLDKSPEKVQKLFDAAKNGDIQSVRQLLESGVDPDGPTRDGKTPLMAATAGGHIAVLEALLSAGADPNLGKGSETPLTIAYEKGRQDVLKVLFAASLNSCEKLIVSKRPMSRMFNNDVQPDRDVPESAIDSLRLVTSKMAAMDQEARIDREPAPERGKYGAHAEKMNNLKSYGGDYNESDMMRNESVRLTMRNLAKANKE